MSERESRWLLDLLFRQAETPEFQFRLRWKPHMVVMWDNRSTQHYAVHDYYPQKRKMERVTIKGDRPFGIGAGNVAAAAPRTIRNVAAGVHTRRREGPARQFERMLANED
jgi:taurine dioxygenase